ncbi:MULTISPECIES: ABC transporter ATP-binding protein [Vagococcus]|uniref:Lipid A export ATP-binding/permease protein MsbA n=1 Tax=Vagococcus fluvialis bH819 TaxID=1255619 RepID=A0A1X6WSG4_9ENTE|nr:MULTISPECIES: ABC transporter ATP-binding protein [Vagococcus]SLM87189.1 Lipid A export ATP-binding/permease protein MsbA [Vagococcus fluvialis bH819]HCM90077.1 ABC transporter ATP-binding protein [Vagococcus sp.]
MSGGPGKHNNMKGKPDKAKNFWKTTKRLMGYLSKRIYLVLFVIILAITSTIFQIRTPKMLGEATTEIFKGLMVAKEQLKQGIKVESIPIDFDKIATIIFIVLGMYLASAIFSFIQQFVMTRISQNMVYQLRQELKEKMGRVPISYYDTHSNGDIMSRAINDMDNISGTLQQSLTQLVTSVIMFFGVLFMMLTISWKLTLVALITVPLSLIVTMLIAPKSQRYFSKQQKTLGLLNNQIEETYGAHAVVKSFNRENENIKEFEEQNRELFNSGWKAQFISAMIMPLMNFIKNISYVFVAVIGGIQVANGQITIGNVQAFMQYTNQFAQPLGQMANLINTIQATIASAERIFEVMDEIEMTNEKVDVPINLETSSEVIFENVSFGYSEDNILMNDFNLKVEKGQKIAIVGPTGAGKTTLINLLERFYDVSKGHIIYRNQDIRNLQREELRADFSMVLQDTWLFTGTIFDNIKYGNGLATEEDVYEAARAAKADDFIRRLPEGYQTILNEEASNISQGQRQLVTIARAFLANPEVLILDEATSSVDTRTEILIQHGMDELLKNRTSFVVAHRLSTIRDADNIIVMEKGSIVETGNHDKLMGNQGLYADLYNSQFSGNVSI